MTPEEQKKWILRHWKNSSGSRITEITKRYWANIFKQEKDRISAMVHEAFDTEDKR